MVNGGWCESECDGDVSSTLVHVSPRNHPSSLRDSHNDAVFVTTLSFQPHNSLLSQTIISSSINFLINCLKFMSVLMDVAPEMTFHSSSLRLSW